MDRTGGGPRALPALLFLSGASALTYEALWARDFAVVYGTTAVGTAVVLAATFAGLALGAALGTRWRSRAENLRRFAMLELAVAAAIVAYVAARPLLAPAAVALAAHTPTGALPASRTLLALAAVLVPATALGATLPAAASLLAPGTSSAAARLYAWNTLGGVAGALGGGLLGVWFLGVRNTYLAAAALDVVVAAAALALGARPADAGVPAPVAVARGGERVGGRLLTVAAATGFATLAAEVVWTRGLAGVLSNSVYSGALVLAAVLAGLVAGTRVAARLPARLLAPTLLAAAVALVASALALRVLPGATVALAGALGVHGPGRGLAVEAASAVGVVFVPATLLGSTLPQVLAGTGAALPAPALARLLAVNTAAGLVGALCAAFAILPLLGLAGGLAAIAALVAAGAAVAARTSGLRAGALVLGTLLAAGAALLPALQVPWPGAADAGPPLYYRDGAAATVSVTADARGHRTLRVNGRYSLGGTDGRLLEARQMHLPLLLHPAPWRALTLGVGTGATAGAALLHPGVTIDGVELLPEVLEAAALFADENHGVLDSPRARLTVDDARTFLLATAHTWDVIVSDLFLPWTAGTAALYSVEMFELARLRLSPHGLFCQWLPLYQLETGDLESIVASFAAVFDEMRLWIGYHRTRQPIAALVGTSTRLGADAGALRARTTGGAKFAGLDDPADLAVLYVAGDASLRAAIRNVQPLTDDRPRIEFTAPAAYFHQRELAPRALDWVAARLDADTGPIAGAPVTAPVRAALLEAAGALTRGDGPRELRATLDALRLAPELRAIRRALVAMARERRAAGDARTASGIAAALVRLAPDAAETVALAKELTAVP